MPPKIGPKRLQRLIDEGVDPRTLALRQQVEFAHTMARILLAPATEGTPRRVPRRLRPQCMARRRDGRRCQGKVTWDTEHDRPRNTKCRVHGGLSTGPRTPEGRQRIGMANRQRAQARRQAQAQASALQAYQEAMAKYEALRQHPMPSFTAFKNALMQIQVYEVERAAQRCRECGMDPRA